VNFLSKCQFFGFSSKDSLVLEEFNFGNYYDGTLKEEIDFEIQTKSSGRWLSGCLGGLELEVLGFDTYL